MSEKKMDTCTDVRTVMFNTWGKEKLFTKNDLTQSSQSSHIERQRHEEPNVEGC